jgi:hypothetical protein
MTALETMSVTKQKIEDLQRQIENEVQQQIANVFKQFLKEHQDVKTIMWAQYTPYFNDGDECVFRVYEFTFCADVMYEYDDDPPNAFSRYTPEEYKPQTVSNQTVADCEQLENLLGGMEDALKLVFGDHCYVIVTEDGITVEEYEHD